MSHIFHLNGSYTDLYQLTMSQAYYLKGHAFDHSVFDYFFRKLPFKSGYAVFAGLYDLLEILEELHFSRDDLHFLEENGFHKDFINYLEKFRFDGTIYSTREGDLVFPTRPVIQVEGTLLEAQIIETLLLNILNFQTLIATKASRMSYVAPDCTLIDFGLRRAQGLGGYHASRAAAIGGFQATSNVVAAKDFGINASGTMAHSFVQSYDDELTAFRHFAESMTENCVLLVDTYDTLKSGIPNAIMVAREMEQQGHRLLGIRLDSGDLAYLAKKSRKMLDDAGLSYVKIAASNQLDDHVIKSLKEQKAPIDVFGIGTSLVTGEPDGALDGVYKLSLSGEKPRIKLSENLQKVTLPDRKQVYRIYNGDDNFYGADAITLRHEKEVNKIYHPFEPEKSISLKGFKQEPLLYKVMENGKMSIINTPIEEISAFRKERLSLLPEEFKRFDNPHVYKVGISTELMNLRDKLKSQYKK